MTESFRLGRTSFPAKLGQHWIQTILFRILSCKTLKISNPGGSTNFMGKLFQFLIILLYTSHLLGISSFIWWLMCFPRAVHNLDHLPSCVRSRGCGEKSVQMLILNLVPPRICSGNLVVILQIFPVFVFKSKAGYAFLIL